MTTIPPRVSIGLPIYNGQRYLAEALESLLGQTFEVLELVICDNASTDLTGTICRDMEQKDKRLRYFRNATNIGGSPNHNRVFELSRGELFMWAGHDDIRHPEYIAKCVQVLDEHPELTICYSKTIDIDAHGTPLTDREVLLNIGDSSPANWYRDLTQLNHHVDPIYGIIRSEVLKKTKLEQSFPDSDRVLAAEVSLHGPFFRIPDGLFYRRRHQDNSVSMYPSRYDRMAWIAPQQVSRISFPYGRQVFEYFRSIQRAPLSWQERMQCYIGLLNWQIAHRNLLLQDWIYNAKQIVRPLAKLVYRKS